MRILLRLMLAMTLVGAGGSAWGQQPPTLSLRRTVDLALQKYPTVRASLEEISAAEEAVQLARTAYLPRADFFAQVNRATRNNIFGMLLNQPYFSAISGPPLESNTLTSVWGSLVGVLVSWEPFDFGLRKANVEVAQAEKRKAEAGEVVSRFQVQSAAADAFLTILAADKMIGVGEAGVQRARVLEEIVEATVKAELRPGADAERARAERARAETQLIQMREAAQLARVSLANLIGVETSALSLQVDPFLAMPAEPAVQNTALETHPLAQAQLSAVDEVKARTMALDRSFFPKFSLEATSYARGSGAVPDFTTRGGAAGLGPNIHNWGVGMSLTFSAFDFASLRRRKNIEAHLERAETAKYDKILLDLKREREQASARLDSARQIARHIPTQLDAARSAEMQASARYRAGLGTLLEVAEAQRLLTQTDIDASLAALAVWRSMLAVAVAQGDVDPFLEAAGK